MREWIKASPFYRIIHLNESITLNTDRGIRNTLRFSVMMKCFRNLMTFIHVKTRLSSELRSQRKCIISSLKIDIAESKRTNDQSLDELDFKKMTDYYGLAVPVMIGESFCKLRGEKMSIKERLALTYLGGLTGLFDDFFDRKDLSENHIKCLLTQPLEMEGQNSNEKLILKFYLKSLMNSSDPERLKSYSLEIFKAQLLSKKQLNSHVSVTEIKDITFQKGGYSVLFYRSSFEEEITDTEKELFYILGGIWQIENDLLDVYKDFKAGIKTLVTTETNIGNIRTIYIQQLNQLVKLVQLTNYPVSNKKKFLEKIILFICIGFVALDVLEKNEKKTNNIFQLEKYERKNLICDLEKPANILKTIHYFLKYNPDIQS
jgi:hypothetical protein